MDNLRCIKIGHLLRQRISDILARHFIDKIGFTTITDVKVAPDLHNAIVYYSVIGTDEDKRKTAEVLIKSRGFINNEMGNGLHIRYTPIIRFEYDDTQEQASKVHELLNKIEEEKIVEQHPEEIQKPTRQYKKRSKKSEE